MPDIFQTQANVGFDSFGNPINPANLNGGWGINPNLLTPSYDAPYRPQYHGAQPYNQYGRVGFFGGMNNLYNPFVSDPYWGNPIDHQQASLNAVSTRPFDAAMWAGQRVVMPTLAFGAAARMLGPNASTAMGTIGGYFTGKGIAPGMGMAFGRGLGSGVAGAFGLRGTAAAVVSGGAGVMGSAVGGMALEYGAAQAMLWGAQKTLWNPYINGRRASQDLRSNFAGVTFGDATGNAVTGGGLGFGESARMGSEITRQGISDMTFSTGEYTQISDLAARAGLMDNVKAKQLTQRVKDVAAQIKLIVSISKDPDIKNAIEELSKLNLAGADISGGNMSTASGAYRSLGSLAAQAGVSVQRLMNTVGAQGQYLYQASGMTPYLGQLAAGNVYAGFMGAQRSGLMSPAQLARMGGAEGATQASLTGQLIGSQTLYSQMASYNQFVSGLGGNQIAGQGQSIQGVVGGFGRAMSQDPVGTMGRLQYFGPQLSGMAMQQQGSRLLEDQVSSILGTTGARRNANGQYDAAAMMPVLTNVIGMTPDQARAFIAQRIAEQDPTTIAQRGRAIDRNEAEQVRSYISQNKLYGGIAGVYGDVARFGSRLTNAIASRVSSPVNEMSGYIGDEAQSFTDRLLFGQTAGAGGRRVDSGEAFFATPANTNVKLLNTSRNTGGVMDMITGRARNIRSMNQVINGMYNAGNADAVAFLNETDPAKKRLAYSNLLTKNRDAFGIAGQAVLDPNDSSAFDTYYNSTVGSQTITQKAGQGLGSEVTTAIADTVAGRSVSGRIGESTDLGSVGSLNAIGAAYDLARRIAAGDINPGSIDEAIKDKKYATLRSVLGGATGKELYDSVIKLAEKAGASGTLGLGVSQFQSGYTMADYKKNPGLIKDPAMKKRFMNAKNDQERNLAIIGDTATRNGRALDTKLTNATGMSVTDFIGATQPILQADKQHQDLFDKGAKGAFDYSGIQGMTKAFDQLSDASTQLLDASKNLNNAASGMSNGSGSNKSGAWSNWAKVPETIFGSGNGGQKKIGDTTQN
jgi:hypothetical protein